MPTTNDQINRAEWAIMAATMERAQWMLEQSGVRHSWMDGALAIARERAREIKPIVENIHPLNFKQFKSEPNVYIELPERY